MKKSGEYIALKDNCSLLVSGCAKPEVRLICFPFIGGNAGHYNPLAAKLPDTWQLCAVDPPGHGQAGGKLLFEIRELVALYRDALKPWFNNRCYILGHSLGGLTGLLLAFELEKLKVSISGLFLSAIVPPHIIVKENNAPGNREIDDEDLKNYLLRIGTEYGQLSESFFFIYYRTMLRADYRLLRSFRMDKIEKPASPLYILYGDNDNFIEYRELLEWKKYGSHVELIRVKGKHNFILTNPDEVLDTIKKCISTKER